MGFSRVGGAWGVGCQWIARDSEAGKVGFVGLQTRGSERLRERPEVPPWEPHSFRESLRLLLINYFALTMKQK